MVSFSFLASVTCFKNNFRDVKPENFLIAKVEGGANNGCQMSNDTTIHIVDFGLTKPYIEEGSGRHIAFEVKKGIMGTPRYMSTNAHKVRY